MSDTSEAPGRRTAGDPPDLGDPGGAQGDGGPGLRRDEHASGSAVARDAGGFRDDGAAGDGSDASDASDASDTSDTSDTSDASDTVYTVYTGDTVDTGDAPDASDPSQARAPGAEHPPRRIRSFVRRAGRIGPGQARALAELGPRFVLPFQAEPINPAAVFGRGAPLVLEIGFGMGDATARIAAARPGTDFLGCEVHEPGVGALLRRIDELGLANLRIVQHDAVEVLERMIAPASLAGIHVFFPDPWHKKKHHKRRLIQPPFVARLVTRLAPGGTLHCATDWEPYAQQMLEVLSAEPALANTAAGYAPRPDYRPLTKFEQRGLRLGHGVWDLVFVRRTDAATPMPTLDPRGTAASGAAVAPEASERDDA